MIVTGCPSPAQLIDQLIKFNQQVSDSFQTFPSQHRFSWSPGHRRVRRTGIWGLQLLRPERCVECFLFFNVETFIT